jgi:hypothetical protein
MAGLFKRLRQRFCPHTSKRVWDISRAPEGPFRVRLYCPDCGWRQDVLREADDVIQSAAGDNAEMLETMRRKLEESDE